MIKRGRDISLAQWGNWAAKTASCRSTQEYYGIIENNKSPEDEPELIARAIASNLRHWLQLRWEPSWENLSDDWRKGTVSSSLLISFSSFFLFHSVALVSSLPFPFFFLLFPSPFEHGFESTFYGAINSLRRVAFLAPSRHGKGFANGKIRELPIGSRMLDRDRRRSEERNSDEESRNEGKDR